MSCGILPFRLLCLPHDSYTIPTDDGELGKNRRLHNWIWYSNLPEGSPELTQLFTDTKGTLHYGTVPRGLVRSDAWENQQKLAEKVLPEGLAEIVKASNSPFLSKIYDVASTKAVFLDGKLFLVGDAQTTLRPNTGMGTTHAAHDCNELEKVIQGKLSPAQWERSVLMWAAVKRRFAMLASAYGLSTKLGILWNAVCWIGLLLGQKVGLL